MTLVAALPLNACGSSSRQPFAALAAESFAFLSDAEFRLVERSETFVRFESERVFVNVYQGRSSHLLGLEIGRLDHSELYSLHEVFEVFAPESVAQARVQSTDAKFMKTSLDAIAATLRASAGGLVVGDSVAFERLHTATSARRKAITLQAQFGARLNRAGAAWDAGQRSRAADLYEAASPALNKTQRRRLEFVRSRDRPS